MASECQLFTVWPLIYTRVPFVTSRLVTKLYFCTENFLHALFFFSSLKYISGCVNFIVSLQSVIKFNFEVILARKVK